MRRPARDGPGAARLRNARRGGAGARSRSSKRVVLTSLLGCALARALPRELAQAVAGRRPSSKRA
eukprot:8376889-Alexandrium_andersonii.AAC.1